MFSPPGFELCLGVSSLVILLNSPGDKKMQIASLVLLVTSFLLSGMRLKSNSFRTVLLKHDELNEVLLVEGKISGKEYLFLVDTGYAGPPVLSISYLSSVGEEERQRGIKGLFLSSSVEEKYKSALRDMVEGKEENRIRALNSFLSRGCVSYASGCTMRLMGIGSTQEQQADMFLCNMLQIKSTSGFFASPRRSSTRSQGDVFVTNDLPRSVHILTCDFLLHSSPCLLLNSSQEMLLNLSSFQEAWWRKRTLFRDAVFNGGAFVVEIEIEGETFRCTMDTGAPAAVSLGSSAKAKLAGKGTGKKKKVHQLGVNGEHVESEVTEVNVTFFGEKMTSLAMLNDADVEGLDGYIGIGLLKCFDILITRKGIGMRKIKGALPFIPP